MLKRVNAGLFEGRAGEQVQIVCRSQNNNGVNDARFEYDEVVLPRETLAGLPGCTFTLRRSIRRFEAMVGFEQSAGDSARYDLFEIDESGGQIDLQEFVRKIDSSPLIDFAIDGLPVRVTRGARRAPAAPQAIEADAAAGEGRVTARSAVSTRGRAARPKPRVKADARKTRRKAAARKTAGARAGRTPAKAASKSGKRAAGRARRAKPGRTRSRKRG
jgi:hypothetical protein